MTAKTRHPRYLHGIPVPLQRLRRRWRVGALPTAALLGSLLFACRGAGGDAAEDADTPLAQRLDALAACTPSDLEVLMPWTGPAFDEEGRLRKPLPAGHVEAVVTGWRKYDPEATALRQQHGALVAQDAFTRPGLLGFQGVESVECDISMSHTLWTDEASMLAFVTGEAHASAMAAARDMHHAVAGAHWSNPQRATAPTWQEGLARMIQEERGAK